MEMVQKLCIDGEYPVLSLASGGGEADEDSYSEGEVSKLVSEDRKRIIILHHNSASAAPPTRGNFPL